ncbi:MAG TPA: ATP-dependent DNA helicase RecQ [Planctomycetota bacterium]|nr:ATP-dependent DNA helicase RecQ [Planctomycetota bacterium]
MEARKPELSGRVDSDSGLGGEQEMLARAREKLAEVFGYASFRPGQEDAIAAVANGQDALVVMPTGSGKSLCYQVPALVLDGVTVVVSPLIALMKDQVDALKIRGVPVTFVNSSIDLDEQWARLAGLERGDYRIVYVAPERFRSRAFRAALANVRVALLAVDEAHCISQWGHDFRPDYRRLKEIRRQLEGVPAIALTATATPEVREDIERELAMRSPVRVVTGFDRPNLALHVLRPRSRADKRETLARLVRDANARALADGASPPAGIAYAGTRRRAEDVAELIRTAPEGAPIPCHAYHAGLEAETRRQIQEDFMEGRLPWVAATNAFGMGVDKSDIRLVVHCELPGSLEAYYQEVGRAGRDGSPADCILLFSDGDRRLQEFFIEGANPSRETIEAVYSFLFSVGENPIFRTLVELEARFQAAGLSPSRNPLAFRSSVAILERAGALERLDHFENLAEVTALRVPWPSNPHPDRASVLRALHGALEKVFARVGDEPAQLCLERWAEDLERSEDSIRRGLAQLADAGWIRYVPPFRGRAIRLPAAQQPLEQSGLDFEALRQRRLRDEARLQEVVRFARSRACRRDGILRYFGEDVPAGGCGRCDVCAEANRGAARNSRPLDADEVVVVQKVLSGVARARGRCGRGRVIGMLRGSKSQDVAEAGLDRLSTYGVLRSKSREELQTLLELLEDAGCIALRGEKYPCVVITERGVRVLKGMEGLELPLSPVRKAARTERPARGRRSSEDDTSELNCDEGLFERLRTLRRRIAEELRVPAYRVFNDRTLRAMARELPQAKEELLGIPGVGKVTLERFGSRFLEVLRDPAGASEGS